MKVIHLISGGDVGGAKTHVLTLLAGLSETEEVQLVCFTEGAFAEEAREMGIRTRIIDSKNLLTVRERLLSMIRKNGYEIIHCHGSRANLIGSLIRRAAGVPVVTTVHSDYRLDYLGRPIHRLTYGTLNSLALRRLDYHIGVSDAMAELLISRGFCPLSTFAIYNGVDFTPVLPKMERAAYLQSIGLQADDDSVIFGIAARLSAVKDVATLIRGFGAAAQTDANIRLVIAGDGEQRAELLALAKDTCPVGSYVFAGWVSDMASFYHALDVNTLTSLSETFPYALTEGARQHCATIASRVGGVPYLIEHGVTGLSFEARDAQMLSEHILMLSGDASLRRQLGEALYEKALSNFSIDATVSRQKELYRTILRRTRRAKEKARDGVLICGAYGKGNAGDDAILDAITQQMRDIDPDLPLYVLTREPRRTAVRYRIETVHTFQIPRCLSIMRKTELYINGGGSLIQDATSSRSLYYYLANIAMAKKAGNRVLMYGCGIGPVTRNVNRRIAAGVLNRYVDVITLREDGSKRELQRMGVTRPEIMLTADPALLIPPANDCAVESYLRENGLQPNGQYALFVLRPWHGFSEKAAEFAAVANDFHTRYDLMPVFLALEPKRDLPAARQVAERLSCAHVVVFTPKDGTLLVGMMRKMRVVIAMRLHALIFAASVGTPICGVVYDPKVSGFLDYLGQSHYLQLAELTAENFAQTLSGALSEGRADEITVSRLRARAAQNKEVAKQLLEEET